LAERVLDFLQLDGDGIESIPPRQGKREELFGVSFGWGADPVTFLFDCIKKNNDGVANKQSGFGAKVVAGATGIDVEAIPQTGLNGGHNSEVNKLCNGVTGPFGGHCN